MRVRKLKRGGQRLISGSPWLLILVLPLGPGIALGAHEADEPVPGTADGVAEESLPRPKAPVFRSPISSFKRFEDIDSPEWKAANDRVGEIGGWRVYAREAFESPEPEMDDPETDSDKSADGADTQ